MSLAYTGQRTEFYFVLRHAIYIAMGLSAMWVAYQIPTELWEKAGPLLLLFAVILLAVVLVIGTEVKGSKRWINLGLFTLQASEVAKLFVIAYLAGYLNRRQAEVRTSFAGFAKPFGVLMMIALLLLAEPDFGAVVVMMSAALANNVDNGVIRERCGWLVAANNTRWRIRLVASITSALDTRNCCAC